MNFLLRALISIKRNTKKSLILFGLLLALGIMMSGAILVSRATANTTQNVINNMRPMAMIGLDYLALAQYSGERQVEGNWWEMAEPLPLTPELIQRVGALPYVAHYEYFAMGHFFAPALTRYNPELDGFSHYSGDVQSSFGDLGYRYVIRGVPSPDFLELRQGVIEIATGRTFTEEELNDSSSVALISQEFATLNQLNIGSTITLRNVVFDPLKVPFSPDWHERNTIASENHDVVTIGIFRTTAIGNIREADETRQPLWPTLFQMATFGNRIYTPNNFVERANEFSTRVASGIGAVEFDPHCENTANLQRFSLLNARENDRMRLENLFVLYNPNHIIPFREGVQEMLPEFYTVAIADNNFDEILVILDRLDSLAIRILYTTIGATLLVVGLLMVLFLRDRKHEMGIYLALGEKRSRIIGQIAIEVLGVALLAFSVALFVGHLLARHLGEVMLLNDLLGMEGPAGGFEVYDLFFRQGMSSELTMQVIANSYDISFSLVILLIFLGVGLGTVLLSVIVPICYILRLNPKKIMM